MKKLIKIAVIGVLILVVLVGVGITILLMNVNALAKRGIESGGTYALGVETKVSAVRLRLLAGQMVLSGLDVANPSGFSAPHFLDMKSGEVDVSFGSLRQDVIEVPKIDLSGIEVNLERGSSGSNYGKILDNLSKLKGSSSQPAPASGGPEKKFVIHDLTISNVTINAAMLGAPGQIGRALDNAAKVSIPIDRIELKDIGKTGAGGTGVTMQELSSIVVQAVLAAAEKKGGGILPAEIMGDLQGALSGLGGLKDIPINIVGKAGETVGQIGNALGKGVGDAAGGVGKEITNDINGLLGGNKKDDKKNPPKMP